VTYVSAVSIAGVGLIPFLLASPRIPTALGSAGFWLFSVFVPLGEMFPLRVQMRYEPPDNTTSVTFPLATLPPFGPVAVPIAFQDAVVGELWVDGTSDRATLDRIASLIAPQVLIGWDTGGEAWEP